MSASMSSESLALPPLDVAASTPYSASLLIPGRTASLVTAVGKPYKGEGGSASERSGRRCSTGETEGAVNRTH